MNGLSLPISHSHVTEEPKKIFLFHLKPRTLVKMGVHGHIKDLKETCAV